MSFRNKIWVSPSRTSKHGLIGIQQTFPGPVFPFNSVRRYFNESELGQFRAETLISIHSLGTFSPDLSREAKLSDPLWHCLQVPRGQAAKFMREADPFLSQTHLLAAYFLSFAFSFSPPSRPIDTIIRNSWFCAHIERRPEWVC